MEASTSKILIETIVRKTIRDIKESPERSTRNVVDMALQFSKGRFQKQFFSMIQDKLKNEHSAYYGLVRDVVNHVDIEQLVTFGMNLGYNSCTTGAEIIRKNEEKLNCNIPWTVILQVDGDTFKEHSERYQAIVQEGGALGIYSWMLFTESRPIEVLPLVSNYPDCAFFLCCDPKNITVEFLDAVSTLSNLMIVVRCDGDADEACELLRRAERLYSVYYPYSEADVPAITSGDLFSEMEHLHPAFSVLLAKLDCPENTRQQVSDLVSAARAEQRYQTMLWEMDSDNRMVDHVISEEDCAVYFDHEGSLYKYDVPAQPSCNLFTDLLKEILQRAFSKQV